LSNVPPKDKRRKCMWRVTPPSSQPPCTSFLKLKAWMDIQHEVGYSRTVVLSILVKASQLPHEISTGEAVYHHNP
jgi:hypothetical protein